MWQQDTLDTLDKIDYLFTGKQVDAETGWYNFGARYLNPTTGLWLSADPALGEYLPNAPLTDDDKKHNQSLPGNGGIYNPVNFALYHFAGNNPIRYTDPDGKAPLSSLEVRRLNVQFASILRSSVGADYSNERPPTSSKMDCSGTIIYALKKMGFSIPTDATAAQMANGEVNGITVLPSAEADVKNSRQGNAGVLNFYKFGDDTVSHVNVGVGQTGSETEKQIIDASTAGTTWETGRNGNPDRQTPAAVPGKINKTYAPFSSNSTPDYQAVIDWSALQKIGDN